MIVHVKVDQVPDASRSRLIQRWILIDLQMTIFARAVSRMARDTALAIIWLIDYVTVKPQEPALTRTRSSSTAEEAKKV